MTTNKPQVANTLAVSIWFSILLTARKLSSKLHGYNLQYVHSHEKHFIVSSRQFKTMHFQLQDFSCYTF